MLLKYFAKALLSNKRLWMMGVIQMFVWLGLIVYVFSQGPANALIPYTGVWYGYIVLASLSTLSVTIAATVLYSSASLAYGFRYTKLSPTSYATLMLESSAIMGIVFGAIQLVATYAIISARFGQYIPPSDPVAGLLLSVLAGAFMLMFGMMLALVAVNYTGLQSQGFLNFVPIMLTIVLGLSQAFVPLPAALLYISPFNAIESLLYSAYSGSVPHVQLTDPTSAVLQWPYLLVSLIVWVTILLLSNGVLLRKLRPRNIEEARPL